MKSGRGTGLLGSCPQTSETGPLGLLLRVPSHHPKQLPSYFNLPSASVPLWQEIRGRRGLEQETILGGEGEKRRKEKLYKHDLSEKGKGAVTCASVCLCIFKLKFPRFFSITLMARDFVALHTNMDVEISESILSHSTDPTFLLIIINLLKLQRWIIESSPCQGGTAGN